MTGAPPSTGAAGTRSRWTATIVSRSNETFTNEGNSMRRSAHLENDYRYTLDRHWGEAESSEHVLHLLMLNPSIADGLADDPTIRRCIGFAQALGFDGLRVVNLFALRSTDPAGLRTHGDPVGPRNDQILARCMDELAGGFMVAAWGADAFAVDRARAVHAMAAARNVTLKCWSTTKDGHPRHPLYVRRDAALMEWEPRQHSPSTGTSG